MDGYVKTILTVIAACLLLQVVQGFGLAGVPGPEQAGSTDAAAARRYTVQAIPMARVLFRLDQHTGRTWMMPIQPQKQKLWTLVAEASDQPTEGEPAEEAPPAPEASGGAEE